LQPPPAFQAVGPAQAGIQLAPAVIDGPQGVGGWLLFFCIVLTVISPLLVTGQVLAGLSRTRFNGGYLIDVVRVVYGIVVGISLWMRRSGAINLLRIYFGILIVTVVVVALSFIQASLRIGWTPALLSSRFTPGLQLVGYTILWFAYFRKSQRVRNTYGINL
jgi:heme/copper-type cytochrome/quinol oxidase subunit 4